MFRANAHPVRSPQALVRGIRLCGPLRCALRGAAARTIPADRASMPAHAGLSAWRIARGRG